MLIPAVAFAGWAVSRGLGGSGGARHSFAKPADRGVPFARGGAPVWPIHTSSKHPRKYEVPYRDTAGKWHGRAARAFKADRGGRHHAGVDLFSNAGDVVVAPESGVVVGRQSFLNGTGAMLIELDSGIVVLLGETKMGGANEFKVGVGSRVQRGQPVTRVGMTNAGSHMLHVETYRRGTTKNHPWYKGSAPPKQLLDPTNWLLTAKPVVV